MAFGSAGWRCRVVDGVPRSRFEGAELNTTWLMNAILNALVVYSDEEVVALFQEACDAEAAEPGKHAERLRIAASDLCELLESKNGLVTLTAFVHESVRAIRMQRNERHAGGRPTHVVKMEQERGSAAFIKRHYFAVEDC